MVRLYPSMHELMWTIISCTPRLPAWRAGPYDNASHGSGHCLHEKLHQCDGEHSGATPLGWMDGLEQATQSFGCGCRVAHAC